MAEAEFIEDEDWDCDWPFEDPEPDVTYAESVRTLQELATAQCNARIEWSGGRGKKQDARIAFIDQSGQPIHRIRYRSASHMATLARVLTSAHLIPTRRAIVDTSTDTISAWLVAHYEDVARAVAQAWAPRKARNSHPLSTDTMADVAGLLVSEGAFVLSEDASAGGRTISLKSVTDDLKLIYGAGRFGAPGISLELRNFTPTDTPAALQMLEEQGSSYLYNLARSLNVSARLWTESYPRAPHMNPRKPQRMRFPKDRFDPMPTEFYLAGNSADRDPLERYLRFYQVLEFYLPRAKQTYAAAMGLPVNQVQLPSGTQLWKERGQMQALLDIALTPIQVAGYLRGSGVLSVSSDSNLISDVSPLAQDSAGNPVVGFDYRTPVAERIYDVRCRIVHTKDPGGATIPPPILPGSREARDLRADIQLVRFVAERVLKHWATSLT